MADNCKDCRYWREPEGVRENDLTGEKRACYFNPPTASLIPGPPDMAGNPTIQILSVRPGVGPDEFCSNFERRHTLKTV